MRACCMREAQAAQMVACVRKNRPPAFRFPLPPRVAAASERVPPPQKKDTIPFLRQDKQHRDPCARARVCVSDACVRVRELR